MPAIILSESYDSWLVAAQAIRRGELVVFPTDTVYGLGCDPYSTSAIDRIYRAKGRSQNKALPLLLSGVDDLDKVVGELSDMAWKLAEKFWPGGLTLIVQRGISLPNDLGSGDTIAVRVPGHTGLLSLIQLCGGALAVTSANRSGEPDALTVEQAAGYLSESVSVYVDGGASRTNMPSTVINCTGALPRILREGAISREQIIDVIGSLES